MPKKLTHEEYVQKLKLENPTIEILSKYNVDILPRLKYVGFFDYQHNCN